MSESEEQGSLTSWASGKFSYLMREWSEAKPSPMVHVQRGDGSTSFTNRHDATHCEQLRGTLKQHGWIVVKNETSVSSRIPQSDVTYNHVVQQILALDEKNYNISQVHKTAVNPMDDLWITADGWSTFFALQAVIALHIGGSKQDQWIFEYIPRGSLVPQRKFVNGKDIILVAGWMVWKRPWKLSGHTEIVEITYLQTKDSTELLKGF